VSDLARVLIEDLAADPVALARLRELVGDREADPPPPTAPAFTVRTLAAELGRTEGAIRAAIARGELAAVKRGRGYIIAADAVAEWARASTPRTTTHRGAAPPRRRPGPGPATEALRQLGV